MKPMSKISINELRELAVSLGADRKKLYGASKQSLVITITLLRNRGGCE